MMGDAEKMVGEVPIKTGEVLRVLLRKYKGATFLNCRIYYEAGEGDFRPTKAGFTVKADRLPEILELIAGASKAYLGAGS
jgi:hypothetical protein